MKSFLQLIRFATVCSNVYQFLTAKLLKQGYRYHRLFKAFYKYNIDLKSWYFMVIQFINSKELLRA